MNLRVRILLPLLGTILAAVPLAAQINFTKSIYYAALGDSVAAGEGAMPVTAGYTYQLYDQGVFGRKQVTDFATLAGRGTRSWDLRDRQVPQLLCAMSALRANVVTITSGANDFLAGDFDVPGIAFRVAEAVNLLLNNGSVPSPVLDPVSGLPCPALQNVTILVSNYYSIPHPVPAIAAQLDVALRAFDQALRFALGQVQAPPGSRVAFVDLYSPSLGQTGLVLIDRRLGFEGPFDFEVHPTNLGHSFIARQFQNSWEGLP